MRKPSRSNQPQNTVANKQKNRKSNNESPDPELNPRPLASSIGPVQVGVPVEPGELEIVATYRSKSSHFAARRDVGLRIRMSKTVLTIFVVAGVLAFALCRNDRALLAQGLEILRGVTVTHIGSQNVERSP